MTSLLTTFHLVNRFLSTPEGELFKTAVEAIILFLIWYMVTSEYGRDPTRQLLLMIAAMGTLFVDATGTMLAIALSIFADSNALLPFLPIGHALELIGIVLITNSFLLEGLSWSRVRAELRIGILVALAVSLIALTIPMPDLIARGTFEVFKALFVITAGIRIYVGRFGRYSKHIAIAFAIYAVTPIINLDNIILFGNTAGRLRVLAQPFPIMAILLLFRVIYLKLVDKIALKRRLEETTRLYEHERDVGKLKDEFVDVVSHELRTPITSIKLYAGLLGKEELTAKGRQMVSVITQETDRLGRLINDILDLSKLEKGALVLRPRATELRKLVEQSVMPSLAEARRLHIRNRVPKGLKAHIDPDRFAQVIVNLYSNAVKFTPEGGTITFTARQGRKGLRFTVQDTGVGIPRQDQERLFEKFYQVGNHLTRSAQGTGLGLAIVKSIVELHGGRIRVESDEGKGAKFVIQLQHRA